MFRDQALGLSLTNQQSEAALCETGLLVRLAKLLFQILICGIQLQSSFVGTRGASFVLGFHKAVAHAFKTVDPG
jgi:hypothetical protein